MPSLDVLLDVFDASEFVPFAVPVLVRIPLI